MAQLQSPKQANNSVQMKTRTITHPFGAGFRGDGSSYWIEKRVMRER
jgi:hypothetical protein